MQEAEDNGLVLFAFYLFGVGALLAWNAILSIFDFFIHFVRFSIYKYSKVNILPQRMVCAYLQHRQVEAVVLCGDLRKAIPPTRVCSKVDPVPQALQYKGAPQCLKAVEGTAS